ncbi:hypothetical protein [Macrococcus brunensis]|uniref:hypothetical protein n=1 Tax=Macrococcus brunensis TaxID=198483 RepID=UPI001EEF85D4|nr:hypothetical protein [Macrococcus brunensis]ULG73700.1 hypothetical protein MGG13_08325 [Macrococcus brunensis]
MTHYLYIGAKSKLPEALKEYGAEVSAYQWKAEENRYDFQYELYYHLQKQELKKVIEICHEHLKKKRYDSIEITYGLNSNRYPFAVKGQHTIRIEDLTADRLVDMPVDWMFELKSYNVYS